MHTREHFLLLFALCSLISRSFALNNDGFPDIYWRNPATGADQGWWLNGREPALNLLPASSVLLEAAGAGGPWKMAGTADFDKDGQLDIVWYDATGGLISYWYM